MLNKVINLRETATEYGFMPTLQTYILDSYERDYDRPAVIVCPGGGYGHVSEREGERIALAYNAAGFHAFVVTYPVAPHKHPEPIACVAKAIKTVREHSGEWHINSDKIAVCGFSAGGHLAASISTLWSDEEIFTKEEISSKLHMPNATILSYPVISSGEFAHKGSFRNLIGEDEEDVLWKKLSLETRVTKDTSPAFLWHTVEDTAVPVENSMMYVSALRREDIPFELHIYPNGGHGMSRVTDETIWAMPSFNREYSWHQLSVEWLLEVFCLHKN